MNKLLCVLIVCFSVTILPSSSKEILSRKYRSPKFFEETVTDGNRNFEYTLYWANWVKWGEAFEICKAEAADLIYIESQRELIYIDQFIKRSGLLASNETSMSIWTSGTDIFDHGHFIWMAQGQTVAKNLFGPNMPDNNDGDEHCLTLYNWPEEWKSQFYLNDLSCSTKRYYICKKDLTCNKCQ